jgi:predicted nucleotidyltransferase
MISQEKNREAIEQVAIGLEELKETAVFVGGAVVSLYADNQAINEIRVTEDIDVTIKVKNYSDWIKIEEQLRDQKFYPDPVSTSIVRKIFKGVPVDIIPDGIDNPVNGNNKWYAYGFKDIHKAKVNTQEIQIFSPSIFIATKFEAFNSRGTDYRTSHDIEDILYVLLNNSDIVSEIKNTHKDVHLFIREQLSLLLVQRSSDEILSANIDRQILTESLDLLKVTINQIIDS